MGHKVVQKSKHDGNRQSQSSDVNALENQQQSEVGGCAELSPL